jgi:hypothetical protein
MNRGGGGGAEGRGEMKKAMEAKKNAISRVALKQ